MPTAEEAGPVATSDPHASSPAATRVEAVGLHLGAFAVAAPADASHPKGVIAAIAAQHEEPFQLYVVTIDVATAAELRRVRLGPGFSGAEITSVPGGVAVAAQSKTALELTWLDGGSVARRHRTLPGLGTELGFDLRGFAGYDDRLLLASGGRESVLVQVLDERGDVVSRHSCHGSLFDPGAATFGRMGDQAVLTNLMNTGGTEKDGSPVCGVHLHGPPRWNEVRLPSGKFELLHDALYFRDAASDLARALGDDLRPTGPTSPDREPIPPYCPGLPGSLPWQDEMVFGSLVIHMISCCGAESPEGIYICGLPSSATTASGGVGGSGRTPSPPSPAPAGVPVKGSRTP
jgi:hypothetical protein